MPATERFCELLDELVKMGTKPDGDGKEEKTMKHEELKGDDRTYSIDYKQNQRGRFLRVSAAVYRVVYHIAYMRVCERSGVDGDVRPAGWRSFAQVANCRARRWYGAAENRASGAVGKVEQGFTA